MDKKIQDNGWDENLYRKIHQARLQVEYSDKLNTTGNAIPPTLKSEGILANFI